MREQMKDLSSTSKPPAWSGPPQDAAVGGQQPTVPEDGRKAQLREELELSQRTFHSAIDDPSMDGLQRPSGIGGWTNAEVLLHITLGFVMLPFLIRLTQFWARLPRSFSRTYAAALNAATPLFNWLNARAPHIGARVLGGSLATRFDRAIAKVLRTIESISEDQLTTIGIYYPNRWDPSVPEYVTLADLISSMSNHLRNHIRNVR